MLSSSLPRSSKARSFKSGPLGRVTTAGAATVGVAALSLTLAAGASAHVRVTPDTAKPGSYATLTFKVPTESDTASTTKLEVDLPTDHPFSYAAYQQMPGWSAKVTTSKLPKPLKTEDGTITEAPSKITWTADASSGIKPNEFQMFTVTLGAVPDTGSVKFAAHQTYSDGKVVNWDETQKGSEEPEHPAPVLYIKDKAPDADAAATSSSTSAAAPASSAAPNAAASNTSSSSTDGTARWLGAGGLVVGLLGLVAAVWAATRRPRA